MTLWVVVPAAGTGTRFGTDTPKQYQQLLGVKVITRTLQKMLLLNPEKIVVAVHPSDQRWRQLSLSHHQKVSTVEGGQERADSVLAAVQSLVKDAREDDWVLVHDVARPCVLVSDVKKLLAELEDHPTGGILATPVSDTVKRVSEGQLDGCREINGTEERSQLWAAQTPQLFRFGILQRALLNAKEKVTDESSAVEQLGLAPVVVEGSRDNIKITRQEDIAIASAILAFQEARGGERR